MSSEQSAVAGGCPDRYPPIDSYAFLSDAHTAALVGSNGSIEWLCAPRFDGPSVFGRILDRERGGAFELSVDGASKPERRYLDGTLVLKSCHRAGKAIVDVYDFLSLEAEGKQGRGEVAPHHVLVRLVTCQGAAAKVRARIDARPDYGLGQAEWELEDGLFKSVTGDTPLWASSDCELTVADGVLAADLELAAGDAVAFSFRYAGLPIRRINVAVAERLMGVTVSSWREWLGRCAHQDRYRDLIERSALVLKGLFFHDSGALLAAPTTSLPEGIGGERNWDYRFTWLRDSALMMMALFRLGYAEEGTAYMEFLLKECERCRDEPHLMIGIGGEHELPEAELGHLEGYACSQPVRIGNAAHDQLQLDTYGEVLDAAYVYHRMTGSLGARHWEFLKALVEFTCQHWTEPDNGIWEVRSERLHFTHSKVYSWVCVDRGIRLAETFGLEDAPHDRWERTRFAIRSQVFDRGYSEEHGSFVQSYESDAIDASSLLFSMLGFVLGDDPRMLSTIDRVLKELTTDDGLVYRYLQKETEDGLSGGEGAFVTCSFWLVSALVLAGRAAEAERIFESVTARVSDLGLLSEELAPDGRMLGNFPQAFSHLSLIQAASNLELADNREALNAIAVRDFSGPPG